MRPFRPTAIATPGATASSMAVLTILSSLPAIEVSRPELLRPSSGATYLIGTAGGAATARAAGGGAQPPRATTKRTAREQNGVRTVISCASVSGTYVCRRRTKGWAAAILAVAR